MNVSVVARSGALHRIVEAIVREDLPGGGHPTK
jgi:hypothetical protein